MKKLMLLLLCAFLGSLLAGCTGMVDGPDARSRRYKLICDNQRKQLVDDWDYLWLMDRNVRLTQWKPRIGY